MKKLKKILLINWLYFSKEIIEVGDVNFLTGKNGAGKSTTCAPSLGWSSPPTDASTSRGRTSPASPLTASSPRASPGPGGPAGLPGPDGAGEPEDRAYLRTDSLEDDLNWVYDLFPRLKERSWQPRAPVRRRAADAGRGPRPNVPPQDHYDG